jgi:hypothetical protein
MFLILQRYTEIINELDFSNAPISSKRLPIPDEMSGNPQMTFWMMIYFVTMTKIMTFDDSRITFLRLFKYI